LIGLAGGLPLGLLSGYCRGFVDQAIMRLADVLLALPDYLLALAIIATFQEASLRNAMLAVGLGFMPKFARIIRASALQESQRDYVLAARALGASPARILVRHVLPNCLAPILVVATLSLGTAILYTSSLSFLGLGAKPPLPEWGAMLAEGREAYLAAPHLMVFPGVFIALAVLGINLLGDGLRDALDVRLK
jgi:peptide/nickel transport system permease protein